MRESLESLINLQYIDCELMKLDKLQGDLPVKVRELEDEVQKLSQDKDEKQKSLENYYKEKRSIENDVALYKENLAKYREQLYRVTTNKEYDAITSEIENAEKIVDEKEFRLLELEEFEETLQKELSDIQTTLQQQLQQLKEMHNELKQRLEETNDERKKLSLERTKYQGNLSRQLISNYERIRTGRDGVALAMLVNGSCGECSSRIPPQRAMEIRQMDHVYLCETCGRILVWIPDAKSICPV